MNYPHLAARLFNTPLMAHYDTALAFASAFNQLVSGEVARLPIAEGRVSEIDRAARKGYALAAGGIGVLTVDGPLVQRAGQINPDCSPITSYQWINAQLSAMASDHEVRAILLEFDSPGGEVANVFELGARFAALQEQTGKAVWASANEGAFSAAYALAVGAERVTMPATAMAGSVGVIMLHVDISRALDKRGYTVTPIYSGQRKNDFSPTEPLSREAMAVGQARVDELRGVFAEYVAARRGMKAEAVLATEAGIFNAAESRKLGLVDEVATFDETLAMLRDRLRSKSAGFSTRLAGAQPAGVTMTDQAKTPAFTAEDIERARAEGRAGAQAEAAEAAKTSAEAAAKAAQDRVAAILGHDEAKGRETLARHLAFKTATGVEDAVALLAASAKEGAAADNPLDKAMRARGNPKVGADVEKPDAAAGAVVISADSIFANRRKAARHAA